MTTLESMKCDYEIAMCKKIQELTEQRAQKFTQTEMAQRLGVSRKTIQNFEAYKTFDSWLFFGYSKTLKNP